MNDIEIDFQRAVSNGLIVIDKNTTLFKRKGCYYKQQEYHKTIGSFILNIY